jgi:energy-coupling factor transporter transmembrane protein EcfT
MLQTALEMLESRKSRTVGVLPPLEGYSQAGASAGVLLSKSVRLSEDVHLAMQSRGFRGEIHLLDDFQSRPADWCWLAAFATLSVAAFWWQAQ